VEGLQLIGLGFAFLLPILAADAGAETTPAPALIPQPTDRFADRGERVDLREAKDGSGDLVYEGTEFSARIAPDGTVTFGDKRVNDFSVLPWLPSRAPMAVPSLQSSLKMLLQGRRPRPPPPPDDRLPPPETTTVIPEVSRYRPDPREGCRACPSQYNPVPTGFVPMILSPYARGDLTDELVRFSGKDPTRFQKAAFLAATHDRRIEMAVKTHARNIRRASAELPRRLQALACDARLTPRERRAILVALRKEMDTATPEGATAATTIDTFVKRYDAGDVVCVAKAP
jgi:hypothetical protein